MTEDRIYDALLEIKDDTANIREDVAALKTKDVLRDAACADHLKRIDTLDKWREMHENQGRPPSRSAQLTAILVGQLLVGAGIAAAVLRAVG